MITPFGKEIRKIRLDRDLLLKDMADQLGFTPSYLSAIENGKKKNPLDFVDTLDFFYKLTEKEKNKLRDAELESRTIIELDTRKMNETQKEFIVSFARNFDEITDEKLIEFQRFIEKSKNKGSE